MRATVPWFLLVSLVLAGCGETPAPGTDASVATPDATGSPTDAAAPGMDAHAPGLDAAEPVADAATLVADAATEGEDAGSPAPDAAASGADASAGLDATTCAPETDAALCARYSRVCGPLDAADNCGTSRHVACGTCATSQVCSAEGECEACVPESASAFCARLQKECGTATGKDNCGADRSQDCGTCTGGASCTLGRCVACVQQCAGRVCGPDGCGGSCGSCQVGQVCVDASGRCEAAPPANDSCAAPAPLTFNAGVATAAGDLAGARNDFYSSACGGGGGVDVVYAFTTTGPQQIVAKVSAAPGSSLEPVVMVRRACASDLPIDELGCGVGTPTRAAVARVPSANAGTWFVVVDAGPATSGAFALEVQLAPAIAVPVNDQCSGAESLTLTAGIATVDGSTWLASDTGKGTCGGTQSGPDVVYRLTLADPKDVSLEVTPRDPTFKPMVYLRAVCSSTLPADERGCASSLIAGGKAQLEAANLPAGDYFLWVDGQPTAANPGYIGDRGDFTLKVEAKAPVTSVPDGCATAAPLTFTNGKATVTGSTTAATDSGGGYQYGPCAGGTNARDVVYSFTLASAQSLLLTLTTPSTGFQPMVYVQKVCGSTTVSGDQLACVLATSSGKGVVSALQNLAAGTYFVWVDGQYQTSGAFTLELEQAAPPANDVCGAGVVPLTANTVQGSTLLARDDYQGSKAMSAACTLSPSYVSLNGPDAVFSYTPTTSGTFTVTVTPVLPYNPAVWVGTSCGVTSSCVAVDDKTSGAETLQVVGVAGTTYYLVVDSTAYSEKAGLFSVVVSQ